MTFLICLILVLSPIHMKPFNNLPVGKDQCVSTKMVIQYLVNDPEGFIQYYSLQNDADKEHLRSMICQLESPENNQLYYAFRTYQKGSSAEEKELANLLFYTQKCDSYAIAPWCFAYVLLQKESNRILYPDLLYNVVNAKSTNNVEACEMAEEALFHALSLSPKAFFRAFNSLNHDHQRVILDFLIY